MDKLRAGLGLVAIAGSFFAACGGDEDDMPADSTNANAINVDKDKDDAMAALQRQLTFLADGQFSRAYEEIHPAQRALYTKEQYGKCVEDAEQFDNIKVKLKEAYVEKDDLITGTDIRTDSLGLTVIMTVDGDESSATTTFHEYKVDGKWYFIVAHPEEMIEGTC
jgi:hypothetical protein